MFVQAKNYADQIEPDLVRSMVLTSLKRYRNRFKSEYGELVICADGRKTWRKKIFPYYKERRKLRRSKDKLDWDVIMGTINTIYEELESLFPYKCLRVEGAEADDIIGVVCKNFHDQEKIMILSGDKDYKQLQKYPSVTQYDPVKDRYLIEKFPKKFLFEQILRGDDGDDIPNFLSDDDTFINPHKRQASIYETRMAEWLADPAMVLDDPAYKKNIVRNRRLIDLSKIPADIETKIMERVKAPIKGSRKNLTKYFQEHRLHLLYKHIGEF